MSVQRSGGLAAVHDTVIVDTDGRWTATRRNGPVAQGQLPPGELSSLRTVVGGTAWYAKASQASNRPCPDGFSYLVSTPTRTTAANDCALESQPELAALIQAVLSGAGL